jgi:hypothetical protein
MPTENLPACITNTNGTFSATIKVNLGKDVRISNTDGRFATGVNHKSGQFATCEIDTRGAT